MIVTLLMVFQISSGIVYKDKEFTSFEECSKFSKLISIDKKLQPSLIGVACVKKLEKKLEPRKKDKIS